jgi:hypothetical protein
VSELSVLLLFSNFERRKPERNKIQTLDKDHHQPQKTMSIVFTANHSNDTKTTIPFENDIGMMRPLDLYEAITYHGYPIEQVRLCLVENGYLANNQVEGHKWLFEILLLTKWRDISLKMQDSNNGDISVAKSHFKRAGANLANIEKQLTQYIPFECGLAYQNHAAVLAIRFYVNLWNQENKSLLAGRYLLFAFDLLLLSLPKSDYKWVEIINKYELNVLENEKRPSFSNGWNVSLPQDSFDFYNRIYKNRCKAGDKAANSHEDDEWNKHMAYVVRFHHLLQRRDEACFYEMFRILPSNYLKDNMPSNAISNNNSKYCKMIWDIIQLEADLFKKPILTSFVKTANEYYNSCSNKPKHEKAVYLIHCVLALLEMGPYVVYPPGHCGNTTFELDDEQYKDFTQIDQVNRIYSPDIFLELLKQHCTDKSFACGASHFNNNNTVSNTNDQRYEFIYKKNHFPRVDWIHYQFQDHEEENEETARCVANFKLVNYLEKYTNERKTAKLKKETEEKNVQDDATASPEKKAKDTKRKKNTIINNKKQKEEEIRKNYVPTPFILPPPQLKSEETPKKTIQMNLFAFVKKKNDDNNVIKNIQDKMKEEEAKKRKNREMDQKKEDQEEEEMMKKLNHKKKKRRRILSDDDDDD